MLNGKVVVLAALCGAWSAEAGPVEYRLYDCSGSLNETCLSLFSPQPAPWEGSYEQGGRVVVNGVDLGVWGQGGGGEGERFFAVFYRHPWVAGVRLCCDSDGDGHPVKWNLDTGERIDIEAYGRDDNVPIDINASGQIVGSGSGWGIPFYDIHPLTYDPSYWEQAIEDWDTFHYYSFTEDGTSLFRINDNGQALGYSEGRLFVLSPVGVPLATHTPEPATFLLAGVALLLCVIRYFQCYLRGH